MKRIASSVLTLLVAADLLAATNSGFGVDAFNRAISASTRGNAVFSPVSFEFDCVIVSEAFGAIARAKFAETMGVLNGLESVYQPLYESLSAMTGGRELTCLAARAFCLPDERKVNRAYRQWMQKTFSAEAFTFDHYAKKGADCWFRARMDGEMEDFSLPDDATVRQQYSFFDLMSIRCFVGEELRTNDVIEQQFVLQEYKTRSVPAVSASLPVVIWKRANSTAIKIPLAGKAWLYALVPREGLTVRDIRGEVSSTALTDLLAGFKSLAEANVHRGMSKVVIPLMDITTESDMKLPFGYFRFPLTGMERLDQGVLPKYVRQRVRFRLDGSCPDVGPDLPSKASSETAALPVMSDIAHFALDRPFLFFVHHESTATILVSGQFMGR